MTNQTNGKNPSASNEQTIPHPLEKVRLCERGKELERNKQFQEAYTYYRRAADLGSIEAKLILRKQKAKQQDVSEPSGKSFPLLGKVAILLFFIFFAALSVALYQLMTSPSEEIGGKGGTPLEQRVYKKEELLYLIVYTALEHFYTERGEYPKDLTELIQLNPENWISFIPEKMVYESDGTTFNLSYQEVAGIGEDDLLTLYFYPKTNELALASGLRVLSVFPVASGEDELPFKTSKVLTRVVDPNGKGSTLGTRGLVLGKGFAIHGTNNPNSIGEYTTKGSIRLFNPDIESLYPYVSKGTPFIVKKGAPPVPMYAMNLPVLHGGDIPFEHETTPNVIYKWKN